MRGILPRHVVAVGQQAALDPLDQVRAAGAHLQVLPGLEERIPQRLAQIAVGEIDLKAALLGIARARDGQLLPFKLQMP